MLLISDVKPFDAWQEDRPLCPLCGREAQPVGPDHADQYEQVCDGCGRTYRVSRVVQVHYFSHKPKGVGAHAPQADTG